MNNVILTAKMLNLDTTNVTPFSITQNPSNNNVIFGFNYNASQFQVVHPEGDTTKYQLAVKNIDSSLITFAEKAISYTTVDFTGASAYIPTEAVKGLTEGSTLTQTLESINNSYSTLNSTVGSHTTSINNLTEDLDDIIVIVQGEEADAGKGGLVGRIDALEQGSIDLSDYSTENVIKLTTSSTAGFQLVVPEGATATINGANIVTGGDLNDYQLVSAKNVANGYAGLDSTGKLLTSQLPIDGVTLTVQEGVVAVNAEKVAVLNAEGKIDRSYLDSIDIQEVYSATLVDGAFVFEDTAIDLTKIEIGDAVILTADTADGKYKAGQIFYRTSTTNGTFADFASVVRDILSATTEQVTTGATSDYYITPAALKNSAPTISGTNITGIKGSAVETATADTLGVVKVSAGNGLLYSADNVISVGLANTTTAGTVVLSGKGIKANADGSFDVAAVTDNKTIAGDGGATALSVKLSETGAIVSGTNGLELQIDTALLAIENNKLVNKAVAPADLAIYQVRQERIAIVAGTNYNSTSGIVEITAIETPKGVYNTGDKTFVAVVPEIVNIDVTDVNRVTYRLDLSGYTPLATGSWEVWF